MIVDASVVLRAFFPDESQEQAQAILREHLAGRIVLSAPALLPYELTNAVIQAERRGRIGAGMADEILHAMADLGIQIVPQAWDNQIADLARGYDRSAYDAAYLALGQSLAQPLITGDLRLYHAIQGSSLDVRWIEDYPANAGKEA